MELQRTLGQFRLERKLGQGAMGAVNRVGHPGILRIFDLRFVPPSCHLLLMEYLEGRPLSSLRAPIAAARAIHLLAGICDALEAAATFVRSQDSTKLPGVLRRYIRSQRGCTR